MITLLLVGSQACSPVTGAISTDTIQPATPSIDEQSTSEEAYPSYLPPVQAQPTPYPSPYSDPTLTAVLSPSSSNTPVLNQTYIDPENQFRIDIPIHWEADADDWGYSGTDGYFRTGYLPEMAFMGRVTRVCERLANPPQGPILQTHNEYVQDQGFSACRMFPISDGSGESIQIAVKNSLGTPELRFFYIEADPEHIDTIISSLQLTNPASNDDIYYLSPFGPMRSGDEIFWTESRAMPPGITITETAAIRAAEGSPYKEMLPMKPSFSTIPTCEDEAVAANQILISFGYELIPHKCSALNPYTLTKDGEILVEETDLAKIETSISGEDFLLMLSIINGEDLVVRKDSIIPWRDFVQGEQTYREPILYGDTVIYPVWEPFKQQLQVKSHDEVLFAFAIDFGIGNLVQQFSAWGEHWVMETHGFLVIDGQIQNELLGFDEIFGWRLIKGKPFYFFRKGPYVGISYDGQILPVYYEDIPYGLCCGFAANNHRFGLRDGIWYHLEIQIDE